MTATNEMNDPKRVLLVIRILWVALILGVLAFGAVVAFLVFSGRFEGGTVLGENELNLLYYIGVGMVVVLPMVGVFVRGQIFKAGWYGDVVAPMHYVRGMIIALALCEGPALFGVVICMLAGDFIPYVTVPALGVAWMVALFPNGRAMFRAKDKYAIGER